MRLAIPQTGSIARAHHEGPSFVGRERYSEDARVPSPSPRKGRTVSLVRQSPDSLVCASAEPVTPAGSHGKPRRAEPIFTGMCECSSLTHTSQASNGGSVSWIYTTSRRDASPLSSALTPSLRHMGLASPGDGARVWLGLDAWLLHPYVIIIHLSLIHI